MPSFSWGPMPQPELGAYMRHRGHYDFIYALPYYLAGLILTLVGCGVTPRIVRRFRVLSSHPSWSATVTTMVLLLFLAIASDVGTLYRFWRGPVFLLHRD